MTEKSCYLCGTETEELRESSKFHRDGIRLLCVDDEGCEDRILGEPRFTKPQQISVTCPSCRKFVRLVVVYAGPIQYRCTHCDEEFYFSYHEVGFKPSRSMEIKESIRTGYIAGKAAGEDSGYKRGFTDGMDAHRVQ